MCIMANMKIKFIMKLVLLLCMAEIVVGKSNCPANSAFTSCGTSCPLTCDNYLSPPEMCISMCKIGCECLAGYVLTEEGRCVLPGDCPAKTSPQPLACQQDKEVGTCDQNFLRFFYDKRTAQCDEFVYAGCGGNSNNFQDLEDCEAVCKGDITSRLPFACQQDKAVGACGQNFSRFFYNKQIAQCQEFNYGGCEGNDNNFQSYEDCEEVCRVGINPHLPSACRQDKEVGSCDQKFSRFFYNKEISQCQEFLYAGCEGNDNNFQSLEDCESVCKN